MNSLHDFRAYICPVLNHHFKLSTMKKPHILAFITILFLSGLFFMKPESGYSQRATSKNNNISVDFIDQFIKNTISVQYEWKASSSQSWAVRGEYVTPVLSS